MGAKPSRGAGRESRTGRGLGCPGMGREPVGTMRTESTCDPRVPSSRRHCVSRSVAHWTHTSPGLRGHKRSRPGRFQELAGQWGRCPHDPRERCADVGRPDSPQAAPGACHAVMPHAGEPAPPSTPSPKGTERLPDNSHKCRLHAGMKHSVMSVKETVSRNSRPLFLFHMQPLKSLT